MAQASNHYIVILCGGSGPRLWPLSRANHPKQFLKLFGPNSLLKETYLRALKLVDPKNILIVTNQKYLDLVKNDLQKLLSKSQIITEPDKKNTAMAILYACAYISQTNPLATVTVFTADHFIGKLTNFSQDIQKAVNMAQDLNTIVTFGISPTSPSPSFGYIITNKSKSVNKFIEKPSVIEAAKLIKSEHTFWNSGIYTFTISTMLKEFKIHSPKYTPLYDQMIANINNFHVLTKIYSLANPLSIDVAISEKSKNLSLIPASFSWSDVGEWKSIYNQASKGKDDIVALNSDTKLVHIGSKRCLISGQKNKLIGLVDINNLAIIDSPDALLICNIAYDGSFKVRDLISKIVGNKTTQNYFLKSYDQKSNN